MTVFRPFHQLAEAGTVTEAGTVAEAGTQAGTVAESTAGSESK